jgi:hypothetical protein
MRVLTGAIAALALVGSSVTQAQVYVEPVPGPVVVAPPPGIYIEPSARATVVDPRTGRTCTIEPSGYRWCWTP